MNMLGVPKYTVNNRLPRIQPRTPHCACPCRGGGRHAGVGEGRRAGVEEEAAPGWGKPPRQGGGGRREPRP
jgi:hypothetical protein